MASFQRGGLRLLRSVLQSLSNVGSCRLRMLRLALHVLVGLLWLVFGPGCRRGPQSLESLRSRLLRPAVEDGIVSIS